MRYDEYVNARRKAAENRERQSEQMYRSGCLFVRNGDRWEREYMDTLETGRGGPRELAVNAIDRSLNEMGDMDRLNKAVANVVVEGELGPWPQRDRLVILSLLGQIRQCAMRPANRVQQTPLICSLLDELRGCQNATSVITSIVDSVSSAADARAVAAARTATAAGKRPGVVGTADEVVATGARPNNR